MILQRLGEVNEKARTVFPAQTVKIFPDCLTPWAIYHKMVGSMKRESAIRRFFDAKENHSVIELKALSKVFPVDDGMFTALDDVNITIQDGDIYGIIGMSGAGKSTLVRCINLLERPTSGQVLIDGDDMMALSPKALREKRRSISMIFQQFNLLMQRTCLKNICFPMEIAGVPAAKARQRALELLDIVGLPDKADAYPAQLSGGQKQRIAIARALASDPEVLLCDEATSALDPKTTGQILELLQKINKERGITVILITHQMSVIEQICGRVAILDSGRVAEIGSVEQVFSNPQSQAGRRLVSPAVAEPALVPGLPIARIAFNGGASDAPVFAQLIKKTGVELSIMGAATRNVDGKAFGTMLVTLPEDGGKKQEILDFLNSCDGVSAEEVTEHV